MLSNTLCSILLIAYGALSSSIPTIEAGTLATRIPVEKRNERLAMLPAIFMMSEEIIALGDNDQCMEKLVCLLENSLPESINNSIDYLSKYLTNKHHDLDDDSFAKVRVMLQNYPRLEHLVDAINLAQSHDDPEICSVAYPECSTSAEELMSVARAFDDDSIVRKSELHAEKSGRRVRRNWAPIIDHTPDHERDCKHVRVGCTASGVGCGICMFITFGVCGVACLPFNALYCAAQIACDINDY